MRGESKHVRKGHIRNDLKYRTEDCLTTGVESRALEQRELLLNFGEEVRECEGRSKNKSTGKKGGGGAVVETPLG